MPIINTASIFGDLKLKRELEHDDWMKSRNYLLLARFLLKYLRIKCLIRNSPLIRILLRRAFDPIFKSFFLNMKIYPAVSLVCAP